MDLIDSRDCGWTGIEDDYPVSIREVIDITAETGALTTQSRVMELKPYKLSERTGRWIPHPVKEFLGWDVCTACGVGCKRREYEDGGMTEYGYIFCPNCGCRMMEVEHETD